VTARHDKDHVTHSYPRAVVRGEVPAGKLVRLACERHLSDLDAGPQRGLWFDAKAADVAFRFFTGLKFSKGRWGGTPFKLEPWQQFLVGSVFGWKTGAGLRRFREAHLEVSRKNGKTELAAGVAGKLLLADGEPGAEVYCVATKRDQAKITFEVAKRLLIGKEWNPHRRLLKTAVLAERTGSKLEPLGADGDSLDGLNVHGAIKDELHAWKQRLLWDVIDTATGARSQPLGISTTTAGHNRRSIWWERREVCVKLLEGVAGYANDELFPLIYCPDQDDDFENPDVWVKGNPNLNVTVQAEEIGRRLVEAKRTPGQLFAFKRLRLNLPTESAAGWLDMARWRACADTIPEDRLAGRVCFGGLDLSQTTDLTAWALAFPPAPDDPHWRILVRHFCPASDMEARERRDSVPYSKWADGNSLTLSEGTWVDYGLVRKRIDDDREKFRVVSLAYDNRFAPSLVQQMAADGIGCVPWNQGVGGMNTACQEFFRMLVAGEVRHQGCPLLEWEAENVAVKRTSQGYIMPDKQQSNKRIDGIAAMLMAVGLAIHKHGSGPADSGAAFFDLGEFGGW
jgi:phage terminase large subunit-like protein